MRLLRRAPLGINFGAPSFFHQAHTLYFFFGARDFLFGNLTPMRFGSALANLSFDPPFLLLGAASGNVLFRLAPTFLLDSQSILRSQAGSFELSVTRFLFRAQSQHLGFQLRDFLSHAAGRDLSFSLRNRSGDFRRLGWSRGLLLCLGNGTDRDGWRVRDLWLGFRGGNCRRLWRVFTLKNLQEFGLVCLERIAQLVRDRAFRRINHQAIAVAGF